MRCSEAALDTECLLSVLWGWGDSQGEEMVRSGICTHPVSVGAFEASLQLGPPVKFEQQMVLFLV